MPDLRTNKSIAQRFDVEFNKRPAPALRRWRRIAAWACVVVPLLLIGLYELVGDRRAYWAGPLSDAHSSGFVATARTNRKDGCKLCHTKIGQPLWKLVSGSSRASSVDDENCLHCHIHSHATADNIKPFDHSSQMRESDVLNCAVCHEEHLGKPDLRAVSSVRCAACHGNLRTRDNESSFHTKIASFAAHPEFAASRFRENAQTPATTEVPGKGHAVYARAQMAGGKLVDQTPLHFNHAAHLSAYGTLLLDSTPQPDDAQRNIETDTNHRRWQKLKCVACHETDAAGKYMLPIKYELHCATCHPLSYSEKLSGEELKPLPHVELAKVYVEAKDRLRNYVQWQIANPEAKTRLREYEQWLDANPLESESAEEPRMPSKFAPAARKEGTLEVRLKALWPGVREVIKDGCAQCHLYRPAPPSIDAEVAIVPPKIPNRWMPHSKFDHEEHKSYTCVLCHDSKALAEEYPFKVGEDSDQERLLDSQRTSDILMPSVAVCQKCHVSRSVPDTGIKANAECVECHTYHHKF